MKTRNPSGRSTLVHKRIGPDLFFREKVLEALHDFPKPGRISRRNGMHEERHPLVVLGRQRLLGLD